MNDEEKQMLREVHTAIVGNPTLGHKGLVERVDVLEKNDAKQEARFIQWGGAVMAAGVLLTYLKDKIFN